MPRKRKTSTQTPTRRLLVNQTELAVLFATDPRVVRRWTADGLPCVTYNREKRYDLGEAVRWLRSRWLGDGDTGPDGISKRDAEIKVLVAREAALRLKLELAAGKYIDRDALAVADAKKAAAFKYALETLTEWVAEDIVDLGPNRTAEQVEQVIQSDVRELLMACAGGA